MTRFVLPALMLAASALAQQKPLAWSSSTILPSTPGPIADFNGDGKLDIVLTGSPFQPKPLQLLLGNGDGTFRQAPAPLDVPAGLAAAGDLNGNGKPDLVVCIANGSQTELAILLNKGDGTFTQSGTLSPAACNGSLMLVDLNHDGKLDLYDSGAYIWFGNGDGTFSGPEAYGLPLSPAIADFNGDGFPDLAARAGSVAGHQVAIWLNRGGTFLSQPVPGRDYTPAVDTTNDDSLAAGDFNGDGKADLAVMTALGPLRIFLSNGDGTFRTGAQYPLPDRSAVGLYAVDIDGDGKTDLVITGRPSILRGNGDGTFGHRIDLCTPGPLSIPFDIGGNEGLLLFGDFNGNGIRDIVDYPNPNGLPTGARQPVASILLSGPSAPPVVRGNPQNAASFVAGPVSAGAMLAVFGDNLGTAACQGADEKVTFNGIPGGILYASPTQINVEVPWDLAGATEAQVVAMRNGMPSAPATVKVQAASPGIYTLAGDGTGAGAIVPANTHQAASKDNPVVRAQYATIYATGLGSVTNQPATKAYSPWPPMLAHMTAQPTVTVSGVNAHVDFSGLTPSFIGLCQVNFLVPANAPAGDAVPVTLTVDGAVSNTVTVPVK